MQCAKLALTNYGGLIDALATARGPNEVRVGLVSFGDTVAPSDQDSPLRDVSIPAERAALKAKVNAYGFLGSTNTHLGIDAARVMLDADASARTKIIILLTDGVASNQVAAVAAAATFKGPNRHLFTIAFPVAVAGVTEFASGPEFTFAGSSLGAFYDQIVGAIAGVALRIGYNLNDATAPVATTYIDEGGNDITLSAAGLEQRCAVGGQPTRFDIRAVFRARPGAPNATVTLAQPVARVCTGPPWAE